MKNSEIIQIIIGTLIIALAISVSSLIEFDFKSVGLSILFAAILVIVNLGVKKLAARSLDADVEHAIWTSNRYGMKPGDHVKNGLPTGIILPILLSIFSIGIIKCFSVFTYETVALKRRAARRFGTYSFTEMTDFHTGLIGAAGIVSILALSFISYFITPISALAPLAAYYAFWNMIPFSKLDGAQIFYGSRVLWTTLAIVTAIFTAYALVLV